MTTNPARGRFNPVPSTRAPVVVSVTDTIPDVGDAAALAVPVAEGSEPPPELGWDAAHLAVAGFTGKADQTLVIPGPDGRALVAIGIGDVATVDLTRLRDLAADFARAVPQHKTLAVELPSRRHRGVARRLRPGRRRRHPPRALAVLRRQRWRRADPDLAHGHRPRRGHRRGKGRCRAGRGDRSRCRDQSRPV